MGMRGYQPTYSNQTPNTVKTISGVRLWGITSIVERETTQTAASVFCLFPFIIGAKLLDQ